MQQTFFTSDGRLTIDTQTAHVLALFMDIIPSEQRPVIKQSLRERLRNDHDQLKTGFVGTPHLCRTLSEIGFNDLAYQLMLNEQYPGWLSIWAPPPSGSAGIHCCPMGILAISR
jgi:alpha-L-rhamnosidase